MQKYISILKQALLLTASLAVVVVPAPGFAISWGDLKLNGAGIFMPYEFDKETQEILSNDTRPIPKQFARDLFIRVTERIGNSYIYHEVLDVHYKVVYGLDDPILRFKDGFGLTATGHLVMCRNINTWDWTYVIKDTPNGQKRIGAFDPDIEPYIAGKSFFKWK